MIKSSKYSYEIDAVLEEFPGTFGYRIYCFEDDDCIDTNFFATKSEAEEYGDAFISGNRYKTENLS